MQFKRKKLSLSSHNYQFMLKKYVYIILLLICGLSSLQGQTDNYADSLKNLLNQASDDTIYVDILNQLAQYYCWSDPVLAIDYAVKAEKIAENCAYYGGLAIAYQSIGIIYADKGNNELALENYTKCYELFLLRDNKDGMAMVLDNMGLIHRREKQFSKALEYHNKSLKLKKELKDSTGISYSYGNIGLVYSEQKKYDKALIQFYNSLRLKETQKDKYGMANSYGNIGVIYFEIESYYQAQLNLERSLMFFEEVENQSGIAECLLYLGKIYQKQNKPIKAIDALNRSLEINKERGYMDGIADAYLQLGVINTHLLKHHKAYSSFTNSLQHYQQVNNKEGVMNTRLEMARYFINFKDLDNAKFQLKRALELTHELNAHKQEYEVSNLLSEIYLKQENYYRASEYLKKASILIDSINASKLDKEITQIQMQYEFEKQMQEKEIEALRIKSANELHVQKMKMVRNITIVILLLTLITALIINKKSIETRKKNKILEKQKLRINRQVKELTNQKHALEKVNQTKDKFMSIIGHDLRNPFNSIMGFVALVTEQSSSMNEQMRMKYLYLIKDAGSRAMSLLDNLLEWAKSQSGLIAPQLENVSINYILRGNFLLIRELASEKNIELIEQFDGNPTVTIDKNMINTVIRNLLSNAIKFTTENGKIWVKTIIKNDEIKIIVQDTGIGIPADKLPGLFEPGVVKHGADGMASSGLGLLLCKDFLLQHRQELRVDSKEGFGTTFWFYLPLAE